MKRSKLDIAIATINAEIEDLLKVRARLDALTSATDARPRTPKPRRSPATKERKPRHSPATKDEAKL